MKYCCDFFFWTQLQSIVFSLYDNNFHIVYVISLFKLYNYFEDSNYVYLVLEMCHNGEMSRYLRERKVLFSEDEGQAQQLIMN